MRYAIPALILPAVLWAQTPDQASLSAKVGRAKVVGNTQIISVWFAPPLLDSFAMLGGATKAQVDEAASQFKVLKGYQLFMVRVAGIDAQLKSHEMELSKLQDVIRLKAGSATVPPLKEIPESLRPLLVGIKRGMATKESEDMHFELLLFPESDAQGKRVLNLDQKGHFEMLVTVEGQSAPASLEWDTPIEP